MGILIRGRQLLVSACIMTSAAGWSQQVQKPIHKVKPPIDLAVTFAGERSEPDPTLCCFWFKGGGVDASVTFWKGFGIAGALTGDHASNYLPSTDENKISFLLGPRYTLAVWKGHPSTEGQRRLLLFGQGLVGVAHGFDTRFTNGTIRANELAVQTGGGLNFYLGRKFGIRPIEVEFVRTQIGATGFSTQDDMRLATGLTWRF